MNSLILKYPNFCIPEQQYIFDIVLGEFLELSFKTQPYDGEYIEMVCDGLSGKLTCNADFFLKSHKAWLKPDSLPMLPMVQWKITCNDLSEKLINDTIPVIYGKPGVEKKENQLHINLDIFGSSFFMLSRYEEMVVNERDDHNRFPATASMGYKNNYLDRPIVNEYIEILWYYIKTIWPILKRLRKQYRTLISCDVDHPYDRASLFLFKTIKRIGARLIRDTEPKLAILDGLNYIGKKFNYYELDSYRNNINWMIDINNKFNNKVAFYFIPIMTGSLFDGENDIRNNRIIKLLKYIHESGHEIGFHPGYNTYNNVDKFKKSAYSLKKHLVQ